MGRHGEALVALVGWGYDDFEAALREAELVDIEECARILRDPLPIERYEQMSKVALGIIERELQRRAAG